MKEKLLKYKENTFIKFVIVGFINTFNYYMIYLFFMWLTSSYLTAHIIGFLISMIGSFYLNCYFTYKVKPTLKKFLEFPLTYVVNITVSTLSLIILVDWIGLNEIISPLVASVIPIPFTYIISKMVLTRGNEKKTEE